MYLKTYFLLFYLIMAITLIKKYFPSLNMEDPGKIFKCRSCKLIRRAWQLSTDSLYKVGPANDNIRKVYVICSNCGIHLFDDPTLVAFNDYYYRLCLLTTQQDCLAAVMCNPKMLRYIPNKFVNQELELMAKLR
jgi:hypothetical protein